MRDRFDVLIVQGHPLLLAGREPLDRLAPIADRLTAISLATEAGVQCRR